MEDNEKHFLIEIFKEIGAHIRTTEQKSLMVTGAYIGLFSIFLSNLINSCLGLSQLNFSWLAVAIQFFFLLMGTCIYIMQQWYRAWKEHYVDVSLRIRTKFITDESMSENYDKMLPYWLRKEWSGSRISVDNLLKFVTLIINFIIVILISYQILELRQKNSLAILVVVLIILAYIGLILLTHYRINRRKDLIA